ncbi:four helix bundle protein [Catalinimonas sp. 4WD22]|uniref:four helix bundle protein n=1 Tax=Catalinimonas locisalis TaxID=3133978 RepID=UPI00310175C0
MGSAKKFEELEVWNKASDVAVEFYQLTYNQHFSRDFSLRDQIRRSAISISSNIAEGFEYGNNKDFIRFLKYAKGSAGELRSQLFVVHRLGMIDHQQFQVFGEKLITISKQISSLIKYLQNHI